MATIDECYRLLKLRVSKSGYNGTISPDDFNLIWPRAEMRLFKAKYKAYGINQDNEEGLLYFKTDPLPIAVDVNGKYTKPNNFLKVDSLRHAYDGSEVEVERVSDDTLANHLDSEYAPPTEEFPIYTEYKSYIQFHPKDIGDAIAVFLEDLVPGKWGYTLVGGRPVYNPATSVQPRFNDDDIDEICYMAMSDAGIIMRDTQVQQFAERKIQTKQ